MSKKKNDPRKIFEIIVRGPKGDEKKLVDRISFPEAAREAYLMVAISDYSKEIMSIKVLE